MLEKTNKVVFSNDEIVFAIVDYGNVMGLIDDVGLVNVDLNNVSFGDVNFDDEYPDDYPNIIHVRRIAWFNRYK